MDNSELKILFPVTLLKSGPELLNPDNTETIWEYYLLENISCGLVRDSKFSPTGYLGCVADRFFQENQRTWIFHVNPNLKWSDGSVVSANEITDWLEALKNSNRRHIKYLKLANKIVYNEADRIIKIEFPFAMDETLLHELSLADSGLFSADYKDNGWGRTVGPYSVETWNSQENILKLHANRFSPLYNEKMAEKVVLTKLSDPKQRNQIFKTISFDVVPVVASASPKNTSMVLPNAPQVWSSHPMEISFFYFNHRDLRNRDLVFRKKIASAVNEFRGHIVETTPSISSFLPEDQLIPAGFDGHLETSTAIFIEKNAVKIIPVKLKLSTSFRDYPELTDKMSHIFLEHGIQLEFEFSDTTAFEKNESIGIYSFLGNQRDASGSWSFLTGAPDGPLCDWIGEYQKYFTRVFDGSDIKDRKNALMDLHRFILESAIAIPFMVGKQRYLLSDKVDASNWNQFDARLRIYELRRK
ncbi:MAG: hypothetical protein H7235_08320 [Bdellovibrionaceae bacterium]|nr:hypothetical protein [Pseudobdellovibrionaceae bacterium]